MGTDSEVMLVSAACKIGMQYVNSTYLVGSRPVILKGVSLI